jgi:hypothetical protein
MKILRLKHTEIDKQRWDKAIENSSFPSIYALSWYLDVVSPNWQALVSEDYAYVFPLTVKQKLKVQYLAVPPFCQQLGLFSAENCDETTLKKFISAIPKTFVRKDVLLNHSNALLNDASVKDNYVWRAKSYSEAQQNYSTQIKRNLKKALGNSLTIQSDIPAKNIIALFENEKGKSIQKIDYSVLEKLCLECQKRSSLFTSGVFNNSELISGAIFFSFNQRWYLIMLASNETGKELAGSTLLIDAVIQQLSTQNISLDFEGSNIPSLARFYKGFGSENEAYQLYSKRFL